MILLPVREGEGSKSHSYVINGVNSEGEQLKTLQISAPLGGVQTPFRRTGVFCVFRRTSDAQEITSSNFI